MSNPALSLLQYLRITATALRTDSRTDAELLSRYAQAHDETAFAALVVRHGAMVWNVCHQVLSVEQDVEDAFQVAFMALSHKATKIHIDTLAGWLHQVAHQSALNIRMSAGSRQRLKEQLQVMAHSKQPQLHQMKDNEAHAALHDELAVLSEKLRVPLVLHYFEGKTKVEIAGILGVTETAVRKRLERAKSLLQERLTQRGITVGTAAITTLLEASSSHAAVSATLVRRTVEAVLAFRAGTLGGGTAELARQVLQSLPYGTGWMVKAALVMLMCVGGLGAGAYVWRASTLALLKSNEAGPLTTTMKDETPQREGKKQSNPTRLDIYSDPLPPGASARIGTLRLRHKDSNFGAKGGALFPDGKTFVISEDTQINFWEISSGKIVRQLKGYSQIAVSPDGKKLAVSSTFNNVELWQFQGVQLQKVWQKQVDMNQRSTKLMLWFAPDGKTLRVAGQFQVPGRFFDDGILCLLDVATGELLHKAENFYGHGLVVSPDGKTLATNRGLWDTKTGQKRHFKRQNTQGVWCEVPGQKRDLDRQNKQDLWREINKLYISSMTFTPDSKALAVITYPENPKEAAILSLWNAATGAEIRQITRLPRGVSFSLAFRPDGRTLIVADNRGRFHFWDVTTGKENAPSVTAELIYPGSLHAFNGSEGTCFSPDRKLFLRWHGPVIGIWDVATGRLIGPSKQGIHGAVGDLAFSPDGKSLMTWASSNELRLWDVETGRLRRHLETFDNNYIMSPICFASDDCLMAWTEKRQIVRWGVGTGKWSLSKPMPEEMGQLRAISEDGQRQLWGLKKGLALLDRSTGKEIQKLPGPKNPVNWFGNFVSLSADGEMILVQDIQGRNKLKVWSVKKARLLLSLDGWNVNERREVIAPNYGEHKKVGSVALSPDGRRLAAVQPGSEPALRLWEVASGHETNIKIPNKVSIQCLLWSPNGHLLAGGDAQGAVWLWDMVSMQEIHRFTGHQGAIETLAFSPDGLRIASGSKDTTALIWDVRYLSQRVDKPERQRSAEELWDILGKGMSEMLEAMDQLVRHPEVALPLLRQRLQPPPPPDLKRVAMLLAQLDDNKFKMRNQAVAELSKMDDRIAPALREALAKKPSPEVCRRIESVLDKVAKPVGLSGLTLKQLQVCRGIEVLERIGTQEARKLLEHVASSAPGSRQAQEAKASLARLAKRAAQK